MKKFQYVKLNSDYVSLDVLQSFNCGHPDFNEFLAKDAIDYNDTGKGVTYILVNEDEFNNGEITKIFAFATIQTASLQYPDNDGKINSIPSIELKYFAIAKSFQKQTAYTINKDKYYSTLFFEWFLIDLYQMSTNVIGFQAIFLRANENGEKLYKRKNFVDATNFSIPYDENDAFDKCTPMCLMIEDNIYSILGID